MIFDTSSTYIKLGLSSGFSIRLICDDLCHRFLCSCPPYRANYSLFMYTIVSNRDCGVLSPKILFLQRISSSSNVIGLVLPCAVPIPEVCNLFISESKIIQNHENPAHLKISISDIPFPLRYLIIPAHMWWRLLGINVLSVSLTQMHKSSYAVLQP